MPKKNKTLCVDDLRHAEYYGMQPVFDELYHRSLEGENFTDLMDLILSRDNILLAYRNIKANGGSYTAGTDKIPMAKKAAVCSYTVEGRALIHTNLSMNSSVLSGLRNQPSMGRSTELTDSRISLFSAQRGKCALSGELFENAADIVCWLKTPAELGGKERYRNMILFHNRFLPLLQECPKNELKEIADTLKATKELMLKVNSLRQQAGLSAIEN